MPAKTRSRIGAFVTTVVVTTAIVIVLIYAVTGSWTSGAVVGGISGVVTATVYPLVFRGRPDYRHRRPTPKSSR